MDINKVWLSGQAVTRPILSRLSSKTMISTFQLQVNESFNGKDGTVQTKPSILIIESLGKMAESTLDRVVVGSRYTIDGYLRQEGSTVRVRTFAVYPDKSVDGISHKEGIKVALRILSNSDNIETAMNALEALL